MDARFRAAETVRHAPIRPSLLQATVDTITAGIKRDEPDFLAKTVVRAATAPEKKRESKSKRRSTTSKKGHRKIVINEENQAEGEGGKPEERTYRSLEDRRFGLALFGLRQRLNKAVAAAGGPDRFIYPEAPPLDYSFTFISNTEEILTVPEQPQLRRSLKQPRKTDDDLYITSSIRLSYNVLTNFEGFINTMYKLLQPGPVGLCWVDLSFNNIDTLDEDAFSQLPNLRILYLHANEIADMLEVKKLRSLSSLHTLTLHGNQIESDEAYRITILYYLPHLKKLDYFSVTKSDQANSSRLGALYEKHWALRHLELVETAQEHKDEIAKSVTAKMMEKEVNY